MKKCSPSFESSRPKVGKFHALMHERGKQWKKVSAQAIHKLSCKWESTGITSLNILGWINVTQLGGRLEMASATELAVT